MKREITETYKETLDLGSPVYKINPLNDQQEIMALMSKNSIIEDESVRSEELVS